MENLVISGSVKERLVIKPYTESDVKFARTSAMGNSLISSSEWERMRWSHERALSHRGVKERCSIELSTEATVLLVGFDEFVDLDISYHMLHRWGRKNNLTPMSLVHMVGIGHQYPEYAAKHRILCTGVFDVVEPHKCGFHNNFTYSNGRIFYFPELRIVNGGVFLYARQNEEWCDIEANLFGFVSNE